jgi:membrane protease subunit HflK
LSEHPEHHDHAGHDHDHEHPLTVIEEPLDPANQSLADALRLSFRVLKLVMCLLIIAFLLSGIFMVDQKEVVVVSRFGRPVGDPREPGLNFAWPYPIDEQIRVNTSLRTLPVEAFWLNLSEKDKTRNLSEVQARGRGLEPGVDGALITGDRALMHLLLNVEYQVTNKVGLRADRKEPGEQISDVMLFVQNVSNPEKLLKSVIQNAAVAEAGRTTADVVWTKPARVASAVRVRAQEALDRMETGIVLEKVVAEKSYYPLQARDEFLSVSQAENRKREAINAAESERTKRLVGVAGVAWDALAREIERLDQPINEAERARTIARIGEILDTQAKGEAGGKIQMARKDRERVLDETIAEVARFNAYLDEYRRSPDLVRKRLRARMLNDLFADPDVVKWYMPAGEKQIIFTLNKDPEEIRQAERELLKKKAGNP